MKHIESFLKRIFLLIPFFILLFLSCSEENIEEINTKIRTGVISVQDQLLPNQNITEKEAVYVANSFIEKDLSKSKLNTRSSTDKFVSNIIPVNSEDGIVLAYIINYTGGGYQIISATKKYTPVIAFSENGNIPEDYNNIDGFSFWINCLKKDILEKINAKENEKDSLYIENRLLWMEYERPSIENRSFTSSQRDHRYWYGQLRTQLMVTPDVITFMSRDLDAYNRRLQETYDTRGNAKISDSEREHLRRIDVALKSEYKRNNLWEPDSYFWMEYNKGYEKHNVQLLKTYWKQSRPYNKYNPKREKPNKDDPQDDHKLLGCVTIAVAQIMKHHNYPGTIVYFEGATPKYLTMDWNKLNIERVFEDEDMPDELPIFLRAVNKGVETKNKEDESSSNIGKAKSFLKNNGYSVTEHNAFYRDIVRSELLSGNPVYVRGESTETGGGHAFVCDGILNLEKRLSIELYYTDETSVKSYDKNPYTIRKEAGGNKVINEEFFYINFGWGGYPVKINSKALDFWKYNKDVKILTIRKK